MRRLERVSMSFLLMVLMIATSFVVMASGPAAAEEETLAENAPIVGSSPVLDIAPEKKLDSYLIENMKSSSGRLRVYVFASDQDALNDRLLEIGLPAVQGRNIPGLPATRLMELDAREITLLAQSPAVTKIMTYEEPEVEVLDNEKLVEEVGPDITPPEIEDLDVDILHGAVDAWMSGWTGLGVNIAVIDTGFDFGHPDLQGQQARYTFGPYNGWPIAYDDYAAALWSQGIAGSWVADTSYTSWDYGGYVWFDGYTYSIANLRDVWGNPVASQSGVYHLGYHTDQNLAWLFDDDIAVLVVDANIPGVYDTVYVDVWHDYDFGNEKACTMGDEISYYDFYDTSTGISDFSNWNAGDGYADLSGGMVYWISDGANVYPGSDWIWGAGWIPSSGDAVAFMGEFGLGQSHGTMTSSAALGTGASMWNMLMGMAPDAKLIAIPFTYDVTASWLFAEFGADGIENTGDEANIVSNSYGWSDTAVDAGYEMLDQIASYYSMYGGQTLWCWSTGNGGPGYGTTHSITDFSSVHVGAGTTMQYRYWLGYEYDYWSTKWGDVIPFSNSGPSKTGKLNAEIIASGAYSLEPAPLNYFDYTGNIGDGYIHFQIGSGTSHATPTVAGGAALGYQAYSWAFGGWPFIDLAKARLMAAADDMHFDPFKQGAGWLNAYTYTQTMAALSGTDTIAWAGWNEPVLTKAALYPGYVYGNRFEMYPNFLLPGQTDNSHLLWTSNYDGFGKNVNVTSKLLLRTGSDLITHVTVSGGSEYLDITSMVPASTDLLKVTMFMSMNDFDPDLDYISDRNYWLELHDWVDLNGDGSMNITGGEWELFRYTVDGSDCNYNQAMIKDPIARTNDGLVVRLRPYFGGEAGLTISVQLDYYELQTFPWITFQDPFSGLWQTGLDIPLGAWNSIGYMVDVTVPMGTPIGTYGAAIYVDDGIRVQNVPVVINVATDQYEFEFGGPSLFDTPYNNDFTSVADRGWRFEVGDWKIYWSMPSAMPPSSSAALIVTANWTELPTDVNLHVLAPDYAASPTFWWPFGPGWIGTPIASSDERYMGAGTFGVYTSTGGPKEVIAAQLGDWMWNYFGGYAPFAIVTRSAVMAGNNASDTLEGYTTWVTINGYGPGSIYLYAPQPGPVPLTGSEPAWYDITVTSPVEVRGSGIGPLSVDHYDWEAIWQDTLTGDFVQDLANAMYTRYVDVSGSSMLEVSVWEEWNAPDIDLGIWYDENMNGWPDLTDPYWYRGISGSTESLTLNNPADGLYIIKVLGYTVTGWPGYFSMDVSVSVPGYITATDLVSPAGSGYYEFNVSYSVPAEVGTYVGRATFGFMGADNMFSIDFEIEVVDVGPPEIQNIVPTMGSELGTNRLVVTFYVNDHVSFYSGFDPGSLWVVLDGVISLVDDASWWVWDANVTMEYPLALSDGDHYIDIWAADYGGNYDWNYTWFTVNTVIEDFTAEFVDPGTAAVIPDGSVVALTEVAVEGWTDPYATVEVTTLVGTYATSADGGGYFYIEPVGLTDGANAVRVSTETLGGIGESMMKSITSDTFCSLWVQELDSPTAESDVDLVGMAEAGATVTVNDVPIMVSPDGTFSEGATLSEGMNSFWVNATDVAGNTAAQLIEVELDTTGPYLAILSPADGATVNRSNVEVSGETDPGADVWVNGVLASDGTDLWSATISLVEGANTVTVVAADELGNSVTQTIAVTFFDELLAMIEDLVDALAENVSDLQSQIDALDANASDQQDQLDELKADLAALQALLNSEIAALEDLIGDTETDLLERLDDLNDTLQADLADLQDQLDTLEQEMQEDVDVVDEKVEDTDAFASMLMYLTLALFAIAVILIGVVWYLMSGKVGGGPKGEGPATEEVEEPPHSDVEREFEQLERET